MQWHQCKWEGGLLCADCGQHILEPPSYLFCIGTSGCVIDGGVELCAAEGVIYRLLQCGGAFSSDGLLITSVKH